MKETDLIQDHLETIAGAVGAGNVRAAFEGAHIGLSTTAATDYATACAAKEALDFQNGNIGDLLANLHAIQKMLAMDIRELEKMLS